MRKVTNLYKILFNKAKILIKSILNCKTLMKKNKFIPKNSKILKTSTRWKEKPFSIDLKKIKM